jgi:lipase chaperone LimK
VKKKAMFANELVYEPVKIKRIKCRNDEKSTKKENKRLQNAQKYEICRKTDKMG